MTARRGGTRRAFLAALGAGALGCASPGLRAAPRLRRGLRVVSTANPSLFPLLVALEDDRSLNVEIVPVRTSADAAREIAEGRADAVAGMTFAAARHADRLRLRSIAYWRGFFIVAAEERGVKSWTDLERTVLAISGPLGSGRNGPPELLLRAALRRSGVDGAKVATCFAPVKEASAALASARPVPCDRGQPSTPDAILLAEPAASGIILMSRMKQGTSLTKVLDVQAVFGASASWPPGQLPLGGLSCIRGLEQDPERAEAARALVAAYDRGATTIGEAVGRPYRMMRVARAIASGVARQFGAFGLELPGPVIFAALRKGDLVFRGGARDAALLSDARRFLADVIGAPVPDDFVAPS